MFLTAVLIIFLTVFFLLYSVFSPNIGVNPTFLDNNWKYLRPDLPAGNYKDYIPASDDITGHKWMDYESNIDGLENSSDIPYTWFSIEIPVKQWDIPFIYIDRMYAYSVEVYLEDKLLGKEERITRRLSINNSTIDNLLMPLGSITPDKNTLYLKIISDYDRTGPCGIAAVGSHSDIIRISIKRDLSRLVLGFFFFILGIFMLPTGIFLEGNDRKSLVGLCLFVTTLGLFLITDNTNLDLMLIGDTSIWNIMSLISYTCLPVCLIYFFKHIFGTDYKQLFTGLWKYHTGYGIVYTIMMILSLIISPPYWYSAILIGVFQFTLVVDMVILVMVGMANVLKDKKDARIFIAGFIIYSLLIIYELIVYILTSNEPFMIEWGLIIFVCTQVIILGRRLSNMHNRLTLYSKELEIKNKSLVKMWRELKQSRDKINNWNKELENEISVRTFDLRNLLDNAGQGFLTFEEDLKVNREYSLECIKIFGKKIEGICFTELLYPQCEKKNYVEYMLKKILSEKNTGKRNMYLPLLPDEVKIKDKNIKIEYKLINDTCMVILTDITEKKFLRNQMENERRTMEMLINAVLKKERLTNIIKDFNNFCKKEVYMIIKSDLSIEDIIFEIYRKAHTFKGLFSEFKMTHITEKLHEFETSLSELKQNIQNCTRKSLENRIMNLSMEQWLKKDCEILTHYFDNSYLSLEKTCATEENKIIKLISKLKNKLSKTQYGILKPDIDELIRKPLKNLLVNYPDYCMDLSGNLNKLITPFEIECPEIKVDIEKYSGFAKSLIHVFKNSVEHGIEPVNERIKKGKNIFGTIKCEIDIKNNNIVIKISDDGKGINPEKIVETVVDLGIYKNDEIKNFTREELLNIIFKDRFTTKRNATLLSGRGVGLSAVSKEVKKLEGTIKVKTTIDRGTSFKFCLPLY